MERNLDDVLEECLERVLTEREPVEQCLARYPRWAEELRPLLLTAIRVRQAYSYVPTGERQRAARQRLLAAMDRRARPRPSLGARLLGWQQRWALGATAAVLLFVMAGVGTVLASEGSEPEQPLYPLKRAVERFRLAVARDPMAKAELQAQYAERRLQEMESSMEQGQMQRVAGLAKEYQQHVDHATDTAVPLLEQFVGSAPEQPTRLLPPPEVARVEEFLRGHRTRLEADEAAINALMLRASTSTRGELRGYLVQVKSRRITVEQVLGRLEERERLSPTERVPIQSPGGRRPLPAQEVEGVLKGVRPATGEVLLVAPGGEVVLLKLNRQTQVLHQGTPVPIQALRGGDYLRIERDSATGVAVRIHMARRDGDGQ
ncbi:MAG: hypothetical protein HYY00_02565 [Chloroflexi bacterium]|nr:hypothetical protein [Chloroflexota bacterium]